MTDLRTNTFDIGLRALDELLGLLDDESEFNIHSIETWFDDDEELSKFTNGFFGQVTTDDECAIILTSKYLRAVSISEEIKIKLDDNAYIRWSGLWVRLNVRVKSKWRRLVFVIFRREWKKRAKCITIKWAEMGS